MNVVDQIYDSLRWKKTDEWCAEKLGIPVKKYTKVKEEILQVQELMRDDLANMTKDVVSKRLLELLDQNASLTDYVSKLEDAIVSGKDKIIEFREDMDKGTAEIKALVSSEPRSPEDIEQAVKIDGSPIWRLSTYWNKEQGNGMWLVSAMVSRKLPNQIDVEDAGLLLKDIFADRTFIPVVNKSLPSNGKALFVYTSDKHIAAYVSHNAIFENSWGRNEYEARMKEVLYEVLYLQSVFGRFEDVFIIDLGDRLDGWNGFTTRGGHKLPQNMTNREAFDTTVRVEKDFYDLIIQHDIANNYHVYYNANSNHGGDFDYMAARAMEIYLNTKYPEVYTRNMEKFIEHVTYGSHVLLLTHGKDDADLKHGLPMHLNEKAENYINKYLMEFGIKHKEMKVSLVKGDLHVDNSHTAYGFRYRNVLSVFGGSKWIGNNFGPTHPGCSFDIIEKDTDRIYEHKILFNPKPGKTQTS